MNKKLWWRIPVVIGCLCVVAFTVLSIKFTYALEINSDLALYLEAGLEGFRDLLGYFFKILEYTW